MMLPQPKSPRTIITVTKMCRGTCKFDTICSMKTAANVLKKPKPKRPKNARKSKKKLAPHRPNVANAISS